MKKWPALALSAGLLAARAKGDPAMPSQAMQHLIGAFRDRRAARANQAPPTLDERRAGFAPAGRAAGSDGGSVGAPA